MREKILSAYPALNASGEIRCDCGDIFADGVVAVATGDDELVDVFVEDVANDLDCQIGLAVQQGRRIRVLHRRADVFPLSLQAQDVLLEGIFGCTFRCRAHDDAGILRHDALENALQTTALTVGQLATDAGHGTVGYVDQETARQRHLAC